MESDLSTLTTDHIVIWGGRLLPGPLPELCYEDSPDGEYPGLWEYIDSSICTLSTLQPLSLNYTATNPPLLLNWVHHWTSLTALRINCFANISHSVNELLLALPELRTLDVVLSSYPNRTKRILLPTPSPLSNLRGLTKLESLNVDAALLDMNLADLNLRKLGLGFSTMSLLEDTSKGETDMKFLLDSFRHMTALYRLDLGNIETRWITRFAQNIPPNLKELTHFPSSLYPPPEVLDTLLFALPAGLRIFHTRWELGNAPRYLEWIESWSGMWTKRPINRTFGVEDLEALSRAFPKCTQMMSLQLEMSKVDDDYIAPLEHLFTNATHFREIRLFLGSFPNEANMTTLSMVANHACHLTTLYLSLYGPIPPNFADLRFPELQDFEWQTCIDFSQWPLLRQFLKEHKQLKSLKVDLDASNAPDEVLQQLWTLFPPTLEYIDFSLYDPNITYPYLDLLPTYLGQSQWRKLFMKSCTELHVDLTLPPTALRIEKLDVNTNSDLPDSLKARLAANKKRNQSLEELTSPSKTPRWCAPTNE